MKILPVIYPFCMSIVFKNSLRSFRSVHFVDSNVMINRADNEEVSSRRKRSANNCGETRTDSFVISCGSFVEDDFVLVIVTILPKGDAAVSGSWSEVERIVTETFRTEVYCSYKTWVPTWNRNGSSSLKIVNTNELQRIFLDSDKSYLFERRWQILTLSLDPTANSLLSCETVMSAISDVDPLSVCISRPSIALQHLTRESSAPVITIWPKISNKSFKYVQIVTFNKIESYLFCQKLGNKRKKDGPDFFEGTWFYYRDIVRAMF